MGLTAHVLRACGLVWALVLVTGPALSESVLPVTTPTYAVVGDGIAQPLSGTPGDAVRGRTIVATRQQGLCLLCHSGPLPEERFQGNLAPDLAGAGRRWTAAQLRLRLVDSRRLNPETIMPSYYRTQGLVQVGAAWRGKTILSAQQIEDVVAYLLILND